MKKRNREGNVRGDKEEWKEMEDGKQKAEDITQTAVVLEKI